MNAGAWRRLHCSTLVVMLAAGVAHATLEAPAEVSAGSTFDVRWAGEAAAGDFISVDDADAAERTYGSSYGYPAAKNPVTLTAPEVPGEYQVRFHRTGDYGVVAAAALRVVDVVAALEVPPQVDAGATFAVHWSGPGRERDFVSIDPVGAGEREYGTYAYPRTGNPLTLRAPDTAGNYEVRYHMGASYRVIARAPLEVGGVTATLDAPDVADAGATIEIRWSGPGAEQDFISVDEATAAERDYGRYVYPRQGNPVRLQMPDAPGDYRLRYHMGRSYGVIAERPIRVEPVTATVEAPAEVVAGRVFEVRWQGPDNDGDFVTLVPVGTDEKRYGSNNGYPRRGNPVRIEAARAAGDYELRYLTGQSYRVLGRAPVKIVPDTTSGRLRVSAAPGVVAAPIGAVELVLDASGSMLARIGGERRIDVARRALVDLTGAIAPGTPFALRVFGHREANSCRTDLELPLAPLDVAAARARIASIESKNLARTPIGASLLRVRDDLADARGAILVVLVTDGEETCDGDPEAAIEALRAAGMDVRVNIVGFAIDEIGLKETFQSWARTGNGGYFDAQSGDELSAAVLATLQPIFEVLDGERVVSSGVVGGAPVDLSPGTYRVRVPGTARVADGVVVEPGDERALAL